MRLLWTIAGIDPNIIARVDPKWRRKYRRSGIGMVLIGLMCALSGAVLFWTIFGNLFLAVPFSLIWALIMLNLYRLVLVTVGNPHLPHAPPYRFPFGTFLFRSLFLLVLGLFIIKPIEVLVFSPALAPHLDAHRAEIIADHQTRIAEFDSQQIRQVFASTDLIADRAASGGYLMQRLQILHAEYPGTWALTALLQWIFLWPFWSKVNWRKRSAYEIQRGALEHEMIRADYLDFRARYTAHMLELTGRDDIWEENYHDMPIKNQPIKLEENDFMRPGSIYAWARIYAQENPS